eukprot:s35_g49.t3
MKNVKLSLLCGSDLNLRKLQTLKSEALDRGVKSLHRKWKVETDLAQDVLRRAVEDRGEPGLEQSVTAARVRYSFLYLLRRQKILPDEVSHNAVAFGGPYPCTEHSLVKSKSAFRQLRTQLETGALLGLEQ